MNYISILRGINVGGVKKIKMDDLRSLYELMGLHNVKTYIQSRNVIFSTPSKSKTMLRATIEKAIEKRYGFYVPIQILTHNELLNVINNYPFGSINIEKSG